ncbi:MAG: 1-acylglycerol-3-phosphate O-acyltransferase [Candidatus Izemoplasmatales bacterium]|nr:1-acylglycerol-3-phosphate O-acyltransferase [Candidatus Izemoplasmatales bacterium]
MIALIQFILTIAGTIVYGFAIDFEFILMDIFKVILFFVGANLLFVIFTLLIFIFYIFISEKSPGNDMRKHKVLHQFNLYIFNFLYRVKPVILGKENLPKDNNFLIISNHIEYTDPLYIKQVYSDYPVTFITKEELHEIKILKNIMNGISCISLSRKVGDRQALQAVIQAIKQVKEGQPIAVFPEGTRSHSNTVKQFKSGTFKIALKAKSDISPVCLYNMHKTVDIFKFKIAKVFIKVLPVIKYDEFKDMDTQEISDLVHKRIEDELSNFKDT